MMNDLKKDNSLPTAFTGIIVPAVTPLTSSYKLDEAGVEKIMAFFYQHSVSPFILGTTGESPSLPIQIKKEYVKKAAQIKQVGTVLYAGISSNCFSDAVDFAKFCFDNGVDAVAATVPSYFTLTESQIKKYFINLADAISIPLIVYNIPVTTHVSIPLTVVDELSHHPNIIATKDSERNEERLQQSLQLWKHRKDFKHFLGWAAKSAEALTGGSSGLIPATANFVPWVYAGMLKAVKEGDDEKAKAMQKLSDVYGNLYQAGRTLEDSLWALKVIMQECGLCDAIVMPPLQPSADEEAGSIKTSFKNLQKEYAI